MRPKRDIDEDNLARGRLWRHRGQQRPGFAISPGPLQESVWDYPRPPALVVDSRVVEVRLDDTVIARTRRAIRVLETASPPTFYLPPDDVDMGLLRRNAHTSYCEWKGRASYFDIVVDGRRIRLAAWTYREPFTGFACIAGYISFYPERVACRVAGERVRAQGGGYYGGWVTGDVVGPFKGEPGTAGW